MGIYGALSTAVTGLKAQSFALENISGNIANSQTTGYKRIETSFVDLIPNAPPSQQAAGSVLAQARATNDVQGDVSSSSVPTNMAISGSGFFVVQAKTGESDGNATFSGATYYTRRGDFEKDKDGFLVNGAGYYLEGLPIDPASGNVSGSVPSVIKLSNSFLDAQPTTKINYQLNLPQLPTDAAYKVGTIGSELLKAGDFLPPGPATAATLTGTNNLNNDTAATTTGGVNLSGALASAGVGNGTGIDVTIGGVTKTFTFTNGGGGVSGSTTDLDLDGAGTDGVTATGADLVSAINTAFGGTVAAIDGTTGKLTLAATNTADAITVADNPSATAGAAAAVGSLAAAAPTNASIAGLAGNLAIQVGAGSAVPVNLSGVKDKASFLTAVQTALGSAGTASINATSGELTITAANTTDTITLTGTDAASIGFATTTASPGTTPGTGTVNTVAGSKGDDFLAQSTAGGAVTVYADNGSPVNVQLRWAKTDSAETGGTETWNLFYLTNSNATGSQPMWQNVGGDYKFGANGSLNPPVTSTTIPNLTVNGVNLGNIVLDHGTNGITQFADSNGTAAVTTLNQNGYPAGSFTSVAVNDNGRVVASYSNGQQLEIAQVVTAKFNSADSLKRLDGATFEETSASGGPIISSNGDNISGSSLEASNTDISTEFTKLIVTQQAYAAGTKIVTSSNEMLQQALNMIR